ncbi:MAG: bifunctional demethylmenaquinone methyltransferase/2-methoxy-6-polyprenyl-1,4-benzoquinol methylase UbiE [Ferruginibacter sp.]
MAKYQHDIVVPYSDSLLSKKEQVAGMFNDIAYRYDFLNRFLSAGIDVTWRKKALHQLETLSPSRILDVATGTGDVAIMALKKFPEAHITGIDISQGMLELGRKKVSQAGFQNSIDLLNEDIEAINFKNDSFDAVTVAFGVRNFEHLEKGLAQIYRVLRPGGRVVILEFSKPSAPVIKSFYNFYMKTVTPFMGRLFSKNGCAYEYLDESIRAFPEGKNFIQILEKSGFLKPQFKTLSFGICSIYCAEK